MGPPRRTLALVALLGAIAAFGALGVELASGAAHAAAKKRTRTVRGVCATPAEPAFTAGLLRLLRMSGSETLVCRFPLVRGKQGPRGKTGPPGPPGPNGTNGAGTATGSQVVIPRTLLARTASPQVDGGNMQTLAVVRGVHFEALCRKTSGSGAGGILARNGAFDRSLWTAAEPTFAPSGESEAKVLVWSETSGFSFKGDAGPRANVPAGQPSFDQGTPSPNEPAGQTGHHSTSPGEGGPGNGPDPVQGEGQHMFVHASNEEGDENRPFGHVLPMYGFATGWIGTSDGVDLLASFVAGLNVLGAGPNSCVFAGVVQPTGP